MPEAGGIVAVESSLLPVSVVIDTVQSLIRGTGEVSIMAPERTLTETSPLLGPQANGNAVRPSNGAISGLRDPDTVGQNGGSQEASGKDVTESSPRLSYIFPAISIGVWSRFPVISCIPVLIYARSSYLQPTRLLSWPVMGRLVAIFMHSISQVGLPLHTF